MTTLLLAGFESYATTAINPAASLENLGKPSMSLETLTQAMTTAITTLAHHPTDSQCSIAAGLQI